VPIEPAKVYFLEADGDETIVHVRPSRKLRDVRSLGEVLVAYQPHGFVRIHRGHAVNARRIREIVRRKEGREWQVRLQPPVNRVLPVSRSHLAGLWKAYGG